MQCVLNSSYSTICKNRDTTINLLSSVNICSNFWLFFFLLCLIMWSVLSVLSTNKHCSEIHLQVGCNCSTTREWSRTWGQETTALWWRIKCLLMTTHQTSLPAHNWTYICNYYDQEIMARGTNRLLFFQQKNLLDAWLTKVCSVGKTLILKCSGPQSWYL